ncbi:MAG TPA: metal ABC transporter substrate-binding protein [Longimicrobiales bacterium]|nr:metal ABC transporter substrate-binding protein [Longimicrobiales bacterium]
MKTALTLVTLALSTVAGSDPDPISTPAGGEARQDPVRVVATLPAYADLARLVGGDQVEVSSIADPNEDAHFVRPKPSFALQIRRADLFVTTGLDLELWVPTLLDRAGNSDVIEGGRGYVTAYSGIELLDIPANADRSAGDVHIYGNPHITTDPLRSLQVARNITTGLKRVAPERSARWDEGMAALTERIHERLFGAELVELLGGETLEQLALQGTLFSFLEGESYEGEPLVSRLGGWLAAAEPFRGTEIICYHKNWAYFEDRFQVTCADYVEAKPGIPPTPGHVASLIERMQSEELNVLLAAAYFERGKVETVARRGGASAVIVPLQPGAMGTTDYFDVVDLWVTSLADAVGATE